VIPSADVSDLELGSGYDFATSYPDTILTIQNAPDYFNLRTETHLIHTSSPDIYTEYTNPHNGEVYKASDPRMQPGGDLYDNPNYPAASYNPKTEQWEFTKTHGVSTGGNSGHLYKENSGYLPYFKYGDKSTWDENAWLWDKEVKDKYMLVRMVIILIQTNYFN